MRKYITDQFKRLKPSRRLTGFAIILLMFLVPAGSYAAANAASIAEGYTTNDAELKTGMAASLSQDSESGAKSVVRASLSNKGKFVGIVTTLDSNLITFTNKSATVVITTSGEANVILTDVNGVVKKGDYLTLSPVLGVLMRADSNDASIIGTALEDAAGKTATSLSLDASDGSKKQVKMVVLEAEINPTNISAGSNNESSFLRVLGENIAGKSISTWQALSALIIFLLILVIEGALIYGAVHSTITALGRNPMAHDAVYKQLLQVVLTVLAILAFGLSTIYVVLQI